jgi:hypothetical protein
MDSVFTHPEIRLHWKRRSGMKIYGSIFSVMLLGAAALVIHGQEAAPPSVDLYERQEQPEPTPALPPNGPELPGLKQLDQSFNPPSLGTDAEGAKLRIEWRQLRNQTVNDPAVQAAKTYAQSAPTDLEKRHRLREYYDIYYQRMSALATTPEIKSTLQVMKTTHEGLLAQPRVRPTPPGSPTPPPAPAKKKKQEQKHKKDKLTG